MCDCRLGASLGRENGSITFAHARTTSDACVSGNGSVSLWTAAMFVSECIHMFVLELLCAHLCPFERLTD